MDLFDDDDDDVRFSIVLRKRDRKIYCNLRKIHDGKLDALKPKQRANSAEREAASVYVCEFTKEIFDATNYSLSLSLCVELKLVFIWSLKINWLNATTTMPTELE